MPHKRAKQSARNQQRNQTGSDHAPISNSLSQEPIPKSVARVLNAAKVQEEWRAKKRKLETGEQEGQINGKPAKKKRMASDAGEDRVESMKIQSGESLAHFNRRVENSLRGTVRVAMQSSAAHVRKAKKETEDTKNASTATNTKVSSLESSKANATPTSSSNEQAEKQRRTEFTLLSTSTPRRLNDIVQAPPELKKLPRGAKSKGLSVKRDDSIKSGSLQEGVLSMARKVMLEEERERAVRMYREMKKQNASS